MEAPSRESLCMRNEGREESQAMRSHQSKEPRTHAQDKEDDNDNIDWTSKISLSGECP